MVGFEILHKICDNSRTYSTGGTPASVLLATYVPRYSSNLRLRNDLLVSFDLSKPKLFKNKT